MAAVRVWVPEAESPGFAPPPISPFWHIAPYGAAGEPHTRLCALGRCRGGGRGECRGSAAALYSESCSPLVAGVGAL